MLEKNFELYQRKEKEEHRKEMRQVLPPDLQLEFPQERPEKEKWSFEGKLLKLRKSQEPEDRLFFESLRTKIKERLGKPSDREEFLEIQEMAEKEKEKIIQSLITSILFKKALEDGNLFVRWGAAQALAGLAQVSPKEALPLYQKALEGGDDYVREGAAQALAGLAQSSPKEALPLYQKALEDENPYVREKASQALAGLAQSSPKEFLPLYQKALEDKNPSVRWGAAQALAGLAQSSPKKALPLYQKALEDGDDYVREGAAQALAGLAQVSPKEFLPLYQKALKDGDDFVRRGAAQALAGLGRIFDEEKVNLFTQILEKKNFSKEYRLYAYSIIASLLKENQDLGKFFLEYFPSFESVKEYAQKINQELPSEKKTANPEEFIKKYQLEIAQLHFLDLDLANSFLSQTLKNHGFPRLERYFENVVKNFNPETLKEFLPKIKNLIPEYFFRLIELSSAYQRMGFNEVWDKILKENVQKEIDSLELIKILGRNLLEKFSQELKIKTKIQEKAFDKWNLEYLPKLFTAEAQYKEEDKKLLKLIMKLSLQERALLPSLFGQVKEEYDSSEKEYLDEIKNYNFKVKKAFEENGLDFKKWLSYDKKLEFNVGSTKDQLETKRKAFENELISTVKELLGSYREKKKGILSDKEAKNIFNKIIKKYGIQFKEEEIIHPEKGKLSPKDINLVLKDFNSEIEKIYQEEKDKIKKENIGTALSHLKDLEKRLPDLEKELLRKGFELEIGTWQREPGYDIFQGNYTHCCVAVENFNRGAMLDYLIDTNLQVVEIRDKTQNETIAQTWLFVAKDSQKNLNLILDNVEINSDYSGLEPQIRENLFKYLQEYAKAFGKGKIKRILLGASSYNDVETKDLDSISLAQTKLAGSPRETEYLDAFGSAWVDPSKETLKSFFIVSKEEELEKELEKKEKREEEKIEIKEIREITPDLIEKINKLEEICFPEELQTPAEQYLTMKGLHLILKKKNEIIGNVSAVETKEVPSLVDKNHQNKKTYYIWTIAIKPEERSLKNFQELIKNFYQKAKERKIKKLVMHARVNEHLSDILQRKYKAKKIRRVENWLDSGEPFDYLELDLDKE